MPRSFWLALSALLVVPLVALVAFINDLPPRANALEQRSAAWSARESSSTHDTHTRSKAVTSETVAPDPASPAPAPSVSGTAPLSEADLMTELRSLHLQDPKRTLALVHRGNEHFAESDAAPERAWYEARALVELRQFDEAVRVAERMMRDFPAAPFTNDVRRHLLSHPLGLPPREH